jgi:hypothetical protein
VSEPLYHQNGEPGDLAGAREYRQRTLEQMLSGKRFIPMCSQPGCHYPATETGLCEYHTEQCEALANEIEHGMHLALHRLRRNAPRQSARRSGDVANYSDTPPLEKIDDDAPDQS